MELNGAGGDIYELCGCNFMYSCISMCMHLLHYVCEIKKRKEKAERRRDVRAPPWGSPPPIMCAHKSKKKKSSEKCVCETRVFVFVCKSFTKL